MFTRLLTVLGALLALSFGSAIAHEGHDHGSEAPKAPVQSGPRAEASSAQFELVAVPRGQELVLYLDRFDTNAPIPDASIEIETPDGPAKASASSDGSYRLPAP